MSGHPGKKDPKKYRSTCVPKGHRLSCSRAILLLDRLFLTTLTIRLVDELNEFGDQSRIDIVTKARQHRIARCDLPVKGTPCVERMIPSTFQSCFRMKSPSRKYPQRYMGNRRKLNTSAGILLWGLRLYHKLRFVLVTYDATKSILTNTDLGLAPIQIIELYSKIVHIENCFREFKQQLSVFRYHFWSTVPEKLNHSKKKDDPDSLSKITKRVDRDKVLGKVRVFEHFVQLCCIAIRMLKLTSFLDEEKSGMTNIQYTRIQRRTTFSEAAIMHYLRHNFFELMASNADSPINSIIQATQSWKKR